MRRRELLRLGSLAPLAGILDAAPRRAPRSCIVIWQRGGASHLDTFDPKPDAPAEIRGEFRAIPTNVPGIRICEHLPLTARLADKLTIVRSMRSGEPNHERAMHLLETGRPLAPGAPAPRIRGIVNGGGGAPRIALWTVAAAPEPGAIERYGDTPLGRECLRARMMVEAGAAFVEAGGGRPEWDTHADNFPRLRNGLLPAFDRAFSSLIADLDARSLLSRTLVVAMGEFGRTPRINSRGGRDHHASAWSVVLAGAGLPGGRVIGATDRTGREVTDAPVSPQELVRTIAAILRVPPSPQAALAGRVVREIAG